MNMGLLEGLLHVSPLHLKSWCTVHVRTYVRVFKEFRILLYWKTYNTPTSSKSSWQSYAYIFMSTTEGEYGKCSI